jgi:hypothetical protein
MGIEIEEKMLMQRLTPLWEKQKPPGWPGGP